LPHFRAGLVFQQTPIPAGVSDEAAAFTVLAAISLQGIRLAQTTPGEAFLLFIDMMLI